MAFPVPVPVIAQSQQPKMPQSRAGVKATSVPERDPFLGPLTGMLQAAQIIQRVVSILYIFKGNFKTQPDIFE